MKDILLCALLCCLAVASSACTVCGCSASNPYIGILPQFHKHFVGLQYQFRSFNSTHPVHEAGETPRTSTEYYNTIQLWSRINLGERIQLFAFVPYISNSRSEGGLNTTISGIGDITLIGNYQLIKDKQNIPILNQSLQLGGGIKMPTGAFDEKSIMYAEGLPNMQPGTRSWDIILNTNYTLRRKSFGLNLDASYTITTANNLQYKYGNRLSTGLLGFYWLQKQRLSFLPQAGLRLDVAGTDYDNYKYRLTNDMSGGQQLYGSLGIQAFYGRTGYKFMYHHPMTQHFASGLVKAKARAEAGIFLLF